MRTQKPYSPLKHHFSALLFSLAFHCTLAENQVAFFHLHVAESPAPSYLRELELPEQLPHVGFISLSCENCMCRFSSIGSTEQD